MVKNILLAMAGFALTASVLSTAAFCKSISDAKETNADGLLDLGIYYETVPVTSTTKCYFPEQYISFLSTRGYTIYSETDGGGVVINSEGDNLNRFSISLPSLTRYYYYANSTHDMFIFPGRVLHNDWSSVRFMVNELEKQAVKYCSANPGNDPKQLTLSYLRCINNNYNSTLFTYCAGNKPTAFLSWVKNKGDFQGVNIGEFFLHFAPSITPNSYLYYEVGSSFLAPVPFYDYLLTQKTYDLIHMFASANCCYFDSVFPNALAYEVMTDSLASWGGDLQQATAYYYENGYTTAPAFSTILDNPNSGFSWEDYLADIDAILLVSIGMQEGRTIAEGLELLADYTMSSRKENFVENTIYGNGMYDGISRVSSVMLNTHSSVTLYDVMALLSGHDPYAAMYTSSAVMPPQAFRESMCASWLAFLLDA